MVSWDGTMATEYLTKRIYYSAAGTLIHTEASSMTSVVHMPGTGQLEDISRMALDRLLSMLAWALRILVMADRSMI